MSEPDFLKKPHFKPTGNAWAEFYLHCEVDPVATKAAGYKVYRDVPFVLLCSKTRKVPKKATDAHKAQFPAAWDAFERRRELQQTKLTSIGILPSEEKTLERLGINTLEELASGNPPREFHDYQQVALAIQALRKRSDEKLKRMQESGGVAHLHEEPKEVRGGQGQQHVNDREAGQAQGQIPTQINQGPGIEIGSLSYNFSL